jgi:hypothetical protein
LHHNIYFYIIFYSPGLGTLHTTNIIAHDPVKEAELSVANSTEDVMKIKVMEVSIKRSKLM